MPSTPVPSSIDHSMPPSYIALLGHSGSHAPQLMHSSVIIIAISIFIYCLMDKACLVLTKVI